MNGSLGVLHANEVLNRLGFEADTFKSERNCCIIMDEVDGMSGDRGGVAQLNEFIKMTQQPIVCIANDRQAQKVRSLASNCVDIKFKAPSDEEIIYLLEKILKEQMNVEATHEVSESLTRMIAENHRDVRQLINHLEFWADEIISDAKAQRVGKEGVFILSPLDACTKLLQLGGQPISNKLLSQAKSLYFVDYNMMDILMFENYLTGVANRENILSKADKSLDSLMTGDRMSKVIRSSRDYSLLPTASFFSGTFPALQFRRYTSFTQFPTFFPKLSSRKKRRRQFREVKDFLLGGEGSNASVRLSSRLILHHIAELITNEKFD